MNILLSTKTPYAYRMHIFCDIKIDLKTNATKVNV